MNTPKNNISQFNTKEQIQEQACLWVSRMDRGLSTDEQDELLAWCGKSSLHYNVLLDVASYWDDASVLAELSGLFPLDAVKKKSGWGTKFALAASVALCSIVGTNALVDKSFLPYLPSYNEYSHTQQETFSTPVGKQSSFLASDGTHITLNTNTTVKVNYSTDFRRLTLVKGEAKFDVSKDESRPFTVDAGDKSYTALGTIFNIESSGTNHVELMVTEGKVLVSDVQTADEVIKGQLIAEKKDNTTDLSGTLVVAGQKALVNRASILSIESVSLDQVHRELAWQQGMLIFNGETLSAALNEISRYSTVDFELNDKALAQIRISGYFEANDIDGLLETLDNNFDIGATKSANNRIVLTQNSQ